MASTKSSRACCWQADHSPSYGKTSYIMTQQTLPTVRVTGCTSCIHEGSSPSCFSPPADGVSLNDLPRRLAARRPITTQPPRFGASCRSVAGEAGFHREQTEICADTRNDGNLLRYGHRHNSHACPVARNQGEEGPARMPKGPESGFHRRVRVKMFAWQDGSIQVCCKGSSAPSLGTAVPATGLLAGGCTPTSHLPAPLSPWASADLQWRSSTDLSTFASPIHAPAITLTIATDASLLGWGAVCGPHRLGGRWHPHESTHHINWLEMKAVQLGLEALAATERYTAIRLEIDNTSTVAFLNRKGGTRSQPLCQLAQTIWQWALDRDLELIAVHVPGKENVDADFQSRHFQTSTSNWMMDPAIFHKLDKRFGPCRVNFFAARHNCQLARYCSWD